MSILLNDSDTALFLKEKILSELAPEESVLFVAEGHKHSEAHDSVDGALIVTSDRILIASQKMFKGAQFSSCPWEQVEEIAAPDGFAMRILISPGKVQASPDLWKLSIYNGRDIDVDQMQVLSLAVKEARSAAALRITPAQSAYEEIKRRREE